MKASSITDSDRLRNMCNHLRNYDYIKEDLREIADKLDSNCIGNVPRNEDLYQSKLIALLEGLECENIPKLVKEGTVGMFEELGIEMAKNVSLEITPMPRERILKVLKELKHLHSGKTPSRYFFALGHAIRIFEKIQPVEKDE